MQYEVIVKDICGDSWMNSTPQEKDGGYGVAMVIAMLKGCSTDISDLSKFIDMPKHVIATAYKRLQANNVFSDNSWVYSDPLLVGSHDGSKESDLDSRRAWCHIAALASGFLGKGSMIQSRSSDDKIKN